MKNSNITEYQNEPDDFLLYYGRASIRDGFYIVNGDERFYHLMGKKTCYSIPELLHPEDVDDFLDAVEKLAEQPQCLISRMICCNDKYRCFYMVLKYNGKVFEGFRSFDMELCEIMAVTRRYLFYNDLVNKYRRFMTLYPGMFFEYEYNGDLLKLYEYHNNIQSSLLYCKTLDETWRSVQKNPSLSPKQKTEFQILCEMIKKGRDQFKIEIDAEVIQEQVKGVRYELKCAMMYQEDIRDKIVGIVSVISGEQPKKSYYLSENAIDSGTGLLNKRAINEYAIEKIQEQTKGLYLAIMDVDDFKRINDNFGHMYGDEVLSKVSEIIRGVLRGRGVAGRFGGDEFMIVLENIDSETSLRRILSTISKHTQWAYQEEERLSVTFSIGVSKYPEDGTTYEELFRKADKCLYIAKAKGKNRYIIYNEAKHGAVVNEEDSVRSIGLKATLSDDKKNDIISELLLKLHQDGMKEIDFVMKQIQSYFDIDGVAIYAGKEMKRIASSGKYVNPIQFYSCIFEEDYQKFFDEQGYYCESNMLRLVKKSTTAYKLNERQEMGKFIQCAVFRENEPEALVSFDFFNRSPKLGATDTGYIKLLGRFLAEIAAEESRKQKTEE